MPHASSCRRPHDRAASAKPSFPLLRSPTRTVSAWRKSGAARSGYLECDENGEFLPRYQTGRYSDGAPIIWNNMGFDRAAMQQRQEGSVVVEMMQYYRRPLMAGDAAIVMSGLADHGDKIVKLAHFLFEAETGTLAACAEAVGVKFDQNIRKVMMFSEEERARLAARKLRW